jgi:hypothetical protein
LALADKSGRSSKVVIRTFPFHPLEKYFEEQEGWNQNRLRAALWLLYNFERKKGDVENLCVELEEDLLR